MKIRKALCAGIMILGLMGVVLASPPQIFNLQGRLTDAGGTEINTPTDMRFHLYDAPTGGNLLITDTHAGGSAVQVTSGLYNVLIGSGAMTAGTAVDLTDAVSGNLAVYVEIDVWNGSAYETLTPRVQLAAAPWALEADTLDGLDSTDFALRTGSSNITTGNTMTFDAGSALIVEGLASLHGSINLGDAPADAITINSDNVSVPNNLSVNAGQLYLDSATGNLGIGNAAPLAKLDVSGDIVGGILNGTHLAINSAPDLRLVVQGDPSVAGTGTVSATASSTTVTGSGTDFLNEVQPGDIIQIPGDYYFVLSVDSATQLTLDEPVFSAFTGVGFSISRPIAAIADDAGEPRLAVLPQEVIVGSMASPCDFFVAGHEMGLEQDVNDFVELFVGNPNSGNQAEASLVLMNDSGFTQLSVGSSTHTDPARQNRVLLESNGTQGVGIAVNTGPGADITLAAGPTKVKIIDEGGMIAPSIRLQGTAVSFGQPVHLYADGTAPSTFTVPANTVLILQRVDIRGTGTLASVGVDIDGGGPQPTVDIYSGGSSFEEGFELPIPAGGTVDILSSTTGHQIRVYGILIPDTSAPSAVATDYIARNGQITGMENFDVPAGKVLVMFWGRTGASPSDAVQLDADGGSTVFNVIEAQAAIPDTLSDRILVGDNGATTELQCLNNAGFIGVLIPDTP
jgi:hypothetical protein